jgi:RHS repeat-associated protein
VVTNSSGNTCPGKPGFRREARAALTPPKQLNFGADYYPYGQEKDYNTSCSPRYKFTGYEYDSETGNYYAYARYYSARLGRFLSPDSSGGEAGNPQSLNGYSYALNNPTSIGAPSGVVPVSVMASVVAGGDTQSAPGFAGAMSMPGAGGGARSQAAFFRASYRTGLPAAKNPYGRPWAQELGDPKFDMNSFSNYGGTYNNMCRALGPAIEGNAGSTMICPHNTMEGAVTRLELESSCGEGAPNLPGNPCQQLTEQLLEAFHENDAENSLPTQNADISAVSISFLDYLDANGLSGSLQDIWGNTDWYDPGVPLGLGIFGGGGGGGGGGGCQIWDPCSL